MPDISATEAARRFSDVLDSVEHGNEHYTIVRRGKAVAHLEPINKGRGSEVKEVLKRHRPDPAWTEELSRLRELVELDHRS
jgi:prevent-host-death family protein